MKKLQFLLLFAFVAFIEASPLSSSKPSFYISPECSKGAVFWCDNIKYARKCNAVDFCITAIWELNRVKSDSGIICDNCKEWVGKARSFIENNDKSGDVIKSLKWTCDLISLDTLKKTCYDVVDDNISAILKMLESQMDPGGVCSALDFCNNAAIDKVLMNPQVVCSTAGLCNNARIDKLLEEFDASKKPTNELSCDQCNNIGHVISHKFHTSSRYRGLPMLPVDQKLPKRKLGVNEQMIALGPLPIDQLMGAKSSLKLVDGGEWCTICQYFLHFNIQEELSDAKSGVEIKEAVGRTCDKFPNSIRPNCHNFINLYGDAIIALLVQEVDPREICSQLKMCPSNVPDVEVIEPGVDVTVDEKAKPTSASCPLCILVVKETEDYIENEKCKDSVKKALNRVCSESRSPPKLQKQCKDFIEPYYDELIEKLVSYFDPKDICTKLKLCPSLIGSMTDDFFKVGIDGPYIGSGDLDLDEIPDIIINGQPIKVQETTQSSGMSRVAPVADGPQLLCEFIMKKLEAELKDKTTRDDIRTAVKNICNVMPKPFTMQCNKFVDQYADQLFSFVTFQATKYCQDRNLGKLA